MVCVHCQKNEAAKDEKYCSSCDEQAQDWYYNLKDLVAPMQDPLAHPMCPQWVRDYYDED